MRRAWLAISKMNVRKPQSDRLEEMGLALPVARGTVIEKRHQE